MATYSGPNVPHRTSRSLAVEKGTNPAGFEGVSEDKNIGGVAVGTAGYADNAEAMRTGLDSVGPPVDIAGAVFTVTKGSK
jgi:hypothetical protein